MKYYFFIVLILLIFISCKKSDSNIIEKKHKSELLPEPYRNKRLECETIEALKKDSCNFLNPDISINNIFIKDYNSSDKIIGKNNQIDLYEQYHFYSKSKKEILTLNQHPGDGRNDISIFKVKKSNKEEKDYKVLNIETFESEKEIKLGVSKEFVKNKLGKCCKEILHSNNQIDLLYRIEQPNDSGTKLLEKYNMLVYFATYKFLNDELIEFEFGFEYP